MAKRNETFEEFNVEKARQKKKRYRAGLDATTPDSNQLGDINDMVRKEATVSEALKQIMAERDLSRAITALYLEVDESIVNDIRSKVDAAFQSVRDERDRLMEHLETALDHAEQYNEGCLYCGEGEIIDGETTPGHQAECWWYRAKAALTPAGGG